ncbi:11298_t:CDS:2 [Ambispora leptoticha]|uniref:11298_t:CDS:1 n=1 Tax=Ambispora leptoticha TaxID=144679 RepID=A0A9N9GUD2_9GLOM|nr:11298_t:CDS:2 [Ambispora leptoticha]
MKFQSIILSLTISLASVIHARVCTTSSETGNIGGECYDLADGTNLAEVISIIAGIPYNFFSEPNCEGTPLNSDTDTIIFNSPFPSLPRSILICSSRT